MQGKINSSCSDGQRQRSDGAPIMVRRSSTSRLENATIFQLPVYPFCLRIKSKLKLVIEHFCESMFVLPGLGCNYSVLSKLTLILTFSISIHKKYNNHFVSRGPFKHYLMKLFYFYFCRKYPNCWPLKLEFHSNLKSLTYKLEP